MNKDAWVACFIAAMGALSLYGAQSGWEYGLGGFFVGFGVCAFFATILLGRLAE